MAKKLKKTVKKSRSVRLINKPEGKVKRTKKTKIRPRPTTRRLVKETGAEDQIRKTKIRVIGIGGGGGSIVSEIAFRVKKASFVAANTDLQALKEINQRVVRFRFGQSLTQGLGTGMNVDLGKEAAQNEKEKIKKLLSGQDFCILVVALGGGAGSGAAPIFAKISRNLGNITYGIFTLPFKFEGEKKMEIAKDSLGKLKPYLSAFSIIPNERIFQIVDKATPLKSALSQINKILAEALEGLIETIYQPGLINIDFADIRTILERKGKLTYLNTIKIEGPNQVKEAVQKVISSPLYPYNISKAKGILFNIVGAKTLGLAEVGQISKGISELVNKEAKIIFGVSQDKKYADVIKITLLATDCGTKLFPTSLKRRRAKRKTTTRPPRPPTRPKASGPRKKKKKPISPILKVKPHTKNLVVGVKPKRKKVKIKVKVDKEIEIPPSSKTDTEKEQTKENTLPKVKVRKNALQVKEEVEEAEKEILDREKTWDTPAFLRRKQDNKHGRD